MAENQRHDEPGFTYADSDTYVNEMSELYAYLENSSFQNNREAFDTILMRFKIKKKWTEMSDKERNRVIDILSDYIELADENERFQAVKAFLYLLQGVFGECTTIEEQTTNATRNVYLLYERGLFFNFVQLLHGEMEASIAQKDKQTEPKLVSVNDSLKLRIILSILYTFVETMVQKHAGDGERELNLKQQFRDELNQPIPPADELLASTLFRMTTRFCNGTVPFIPIRKVLLLLWKTLLFTLGGFDELRRLKNFYRSRAGLPEVKEDTVEMTQRLRPMTPPLSATEMIAEKVESFSNRSNQAKKRFRDTKKPMIKQTSMIDATPDKFMSDFGNDGLEDESNDIVNEDEGKSLDSNKNDLETSNDELSDEWVDDDKASDDFVKTMTPRPSSPISGGELNAPICPMSSHYKGLPWTPKVSTKDIEVFLEKARSKFIGFLMPHNRTTVEGFPQPIIESLRVLERHLYIPLSEVQIEHEEKLTKYPLTMRELDEKALCSPAEKLYEAIHQHLTQYVIILLKILLAAGPWTKPKTESVLIMSDVMPGDVPMSTAQLIHLGTDQCRHREIIIKAVSSILLLLLKHYKLNHIYQFEFIGQQLMSANCIPLILKLFNQDVAGYVKNFNKLSKLEFPYCVLENHTNDCETFDNGGVCNEEDEMMTDSNLPMDSSFCWRNLFSCINLARILNKLIKGKDSRIMIMIFFKSGPILKRALSVRHAMFQLYILKLLKMQTRYQGRQWRKSNMTTMSSIYQRVRHRLTDDWAFGNDIEAKPWDYQAFEYSLQSSIVRFHDRRYDKENLLALLGDQGAHFSQLKAQCMSMNLLKPIDDNLMSILNSDYVFTQEFKDNYEQWLKREVFLYKIDWNQLLIDTNTMIDG